MSGANRLALCVLFQLLAGSAAAQTFPTDEADWNPLPCKKSVMIDEHRDEKDALDERDVVGSLGAPAGFAASDSKFVYLRLRVDKDPAPGDQLQPYAWGVAVSIDSDPRSFEILATVNGQSGKVELYRNTATTRVDDPADPADEPPVQSYPFSTHGLTGVATDTSHGGDNDHFVGMAIPWSAFKPLGLTQKTRTVLWAGSSSKANTLDGDLACHDASQTAPALSHASDAFTVLDPNLDSDGDGYPDRVELRAGSDPDDRESVPPDNPAFGVDLEGGGGCSVAAPRDPRGAACACAAPLALFGLLPLLRRRVSRR